MFHDRGRQVCSLAAFRDGILRLGIDVQSDVITKIRLRTCVELLLHFLVREVKERKSASVGQTEERVAEYQRLAAVLGRLYPSRTQRQANNVLVEVPGSFLVGDHECMVAHARGQFSLTCGHELPL